MIPKSGHSLSAKIMRNQVHAQGRLFPCLLAADFSSQKRVDKPAQSAGRLRRQAALVTRLPGNRFSQA
jgi:hypothetical protein